VTAGALAQSTKKNRCGKRRMKNVRNITYEAVYKFGKVANGEIIMYDEDGINGINTPLIRYAQAKSKHLRLHARLLPCF
jgi:hypothetical protein